jgi:hypothetical protein
MPTGIAVDLQSLVLTWARARRGCKELIQFDVGVGGIQFAIACTRRREIIAGGYGCVTE